MKYYIKATFFDDTVLDGVSDSAVAKLMNCSRTYINALRRNEKTASLEFYSHMKMRIDRYLKRI